MHDHHGHPVDIYQNCKHELGLILGQILGRQKCLFRCTAPGGSSLDAVEKVTAAMEDCMLFNAGKGSVYACDGATHELEACIMEGRSGRSGSVACVRGAIQQTFII